MSDNQALRLGSVVCHTLRKGPDGHVTPASRGEATQAVARTARKLGVDGGDGLDRGSTMRVIEAAEHHLC
ncbi:hypothetical protein H7K14_08185 [Mycolicibacter longobardus]|uniref:hypothetical protein n=1 Tax=Mycolicibacter longobardus TaxID=1108812 RepID=UPI0021F327A0|nr:hypothetical protein [Mycolicibacter longobardus]MCV7383815.1 hypothetical protein [Mycolicibacter longobardus]